MWRVSVADNLQVSLTDYDPNNELPIQPHQWGVHLEFPPNGNLPGGSWGFDAPNELWAKVIQTGVNALTNGEFQDLLDNTEH